MGKIGGILHNNSKGLELVFGRKRGIGNVSQKYQKHEGYVSFKSIH